MRRVWHFLDEAWGPVLAAYLMVRAGLDYGWWAPFALAGIAFVIFEVIHLYIRWRIDREHP
jgi:hypothetical protein